jgi:hypothetical protein
MTVKGQSLPPVLNLVKHSATNDILGARMYRSLILTSARSWGERSASHPCRFTPGERAPLPIGQEVGWTSEPIWTIWRSLTFVTVRTRTSNLSVVQPVDSFYTDCATAAHRI